MSNREDEKLVHYARKIIMLEQGVHASPETWAHLISGYGPHRRRKRGHRKPLHELLSFFQDPPARMVMMNLL